VFPVVGGATKVPSLIPLAKFGFVFSKIGGAQILPFTLDTQPSIRRPRVFAAAAGHSFTISELALLRTKSKSCA
jgi:hypothetical protein